MDGKQFQLVLFAIILTMGLIVLIGLVGNPFSGQYRMMHQCDAAPDGFGDPNCYNYKDDFIGEWYPFEISKQIAERSGADMHRFCTYHKYKGSCLKIPQVD